MIKDKLIKISALLLAVVLISGIFYAVGDTPLPVEIDAGAVNITYNMTSGYKSGKYYDNLKKLSLSGDQARDVLAIALSQVGYHEGDSESELSGVGHTGTRDFVEYNVLYGRLDNAQGNGKSYGYYWCASFINWCLRMAGVSKDASGSEVSCQRWYADCNKMDILRSKGEYIPKSGDIIFFRDSGSSSDSTHVGLVRYSDGKYVYTVEGNTSNGSEYSSNGEYVALKKYALTSSYIVGYATPKYESNKSARAVDYSGGFLSLGDYISSTDTKIYADTELKSQTSKSIPVYTVFTVTEIKNDCLKVKYDGAEGYIKADTVTQITTSEDIYTVNYVSESGTPMYMPQYRRAGEQKSAYTNVPTREKSGFVGWKTETSPDSIFEPGDKLPDTNADITLTAVFDSNYYVISFKNEDGTLIDQVHGYYGTEFDFPDAPKAPEGYVFSGWDTSGKGVIKGNASYTVAFMTEEEFAAVGGGTDTEIESTPNDKGCASSVSGTTLMITAPIAIIPMFFRKKKRTVNNK